MPMRGVRQIKDARWSVISEWGPGSKPCQFPE